MSIDRNGRAHAGKRQPGAGQFQRQVRLPSDLSGLRGNPLAGDLHPELEAVLESAARLQELVPDTVLVGGSAAALYARHRLSYDHDHVLQSLHERFDVVFDALAREGDFVLARAVPQKIILGELGGIEVGVRQLIRKRPLEVQHLTLLSGKMLTVPTEAETVRIKSYLIVKRNQVRDYLDVAAMSGKYGPEVVAEWIRNIDDYYTDDTAADGSAPVSTQLLRQLSDPSPKDSGTLKNFGNYKGLDKRWADWDQVREQCNLISTELGSLMEQDS